MLSKSIFLLSLPLLTLAAPGIPWVRPYQPYIPPYHPGDAFDPHSGLQYGPAYVLGAEDLGPGPELIKAHQNLAKYGSIEVPESEDDEEDEDIIAATTPPSPETQRQAAKGNSKVFNDMFRISEGNSVALFNGVPVDRNTGHAIKITNENENPGGSTVNKGSLKSVNNEDASTAPPTLRKRGLRNKLGLDFLQAPSTEDATRNAQKAFADGSIGRMNIPAGNAPQQGGANMPPPPPPPHPMMAKFPVAQQGNPASPLGFQQHPPMPQPQQQQPQAQKAAAPAPQQAAPRPQQQAPQQQQQPQKAQNPNANPKNFSTSTATTGKPKSKDEKKAQKAEGKDLSSQIEEAKSVHGNKWLIQNGALHQLKPGERPTRKAMEIVGGAMDDDSKLSQKWRDENEAGGNLMKRSIGNKLGLGMFDFNRNPRSKSLAHQDQSGQSQALGPLEKQITQLKQSDDTLQVNKQLEEEGEDDDEDDIGDDDQQDFLPENPNHHPQSKQKPKPKPKSSGSSSQPPNGDSNSDAQSDDTTESGDSDPDPSPVPLTMDRLSNAKSFAILNGVAVEVDGNPVTAGKKMKKPRPAFPRFRDRHSDNYPSDSSYDGTWNEFSYHPDLQKRSALPMPIPAASADPGKKVPGVNPFGRNPLSAKRAPQNGGNGGAKTKKETIGEINSCNVNGQEKVVRTPRSQSEDTVRVYGGGNYRKCNGKDCGVPGQLGCPKLPGGINEAGSGKRGVAGIF